MSVAERAFALMVLLFPRAFRDRFGQDMRELFRDQLRSARIRSGTLGVLGLGISILPSFARALVLEHYDAIRDRRRLVRTRRQRPQRTDGMLTTLANDLRFAL